MDQTPPPAPQPIDLEKRVGQFVKLRDLKAELVERHKAELAPFNDAMEALKAEIAAGMDTLNVDSVKTSCGTASFTSKDSASVSDMDAFWAYVVTTGQFELLDKKANVTAVRAHIDNPANNGTPPPGVNYSVFRDVGVRRKTGT